MKVLRKDDPRPAKASAAAVGFFDDDFVVVRFEDADAFL